MFQMCEAMKWNHLPVAGGLYDQDPDLLDGFGIIFAARSEYQAEENAKQERERKRGRAGTGVRRPRGRSR